MGKRRRRPSKLSIWPSIVHVHIQMGQTLLGPLLGLGCACLFPWWWKRIKKAHLESYRWLVQTVDRTMFVSVAHRHWQDADAAAKPTDADIEQQSKQWRLMCVEAIRREIVRDLRQNLISFACCTAAMWIVLAFLARVLLLHFQYPLTLGWAALWLSSGWIIVVSGAASLSAAYALQDAILLYASPSIFPIDDKLIFLLALAKRTTDGLWWLNTACKQHTRQALLQAARLSRARLGRALGANQHWTTAHTLRIAGVFRYLADEATFSCRDNLRSLREGIVVAMSPLAFGWYGELSEVFRDSPLPEDEPSFLRKTAVTLALFGAGVGTVVLVNYLGPGKWFEPLASNWKTLSVAWMLFSIAKGFGVDISELKDMTRPFVGKP